MSTILFLSVLNILGEAQRNKVITATTTSSTTATFQSTGILYQNGLITCPSLSDCYINCNSADYACENIVIDASAATYLRLNCDKFLATCQYINITAAPSYAADIYCYSEQACTYGDMTLTSVLKNVYIGCYSATAPNGYGPCYDTQFRLGGTNAADVDCMTYRACQSEFYLDDVNSFVFDSNVDGAVSNVKIYAQNISSSANIFLNCNAVGSCTGGLHIFAPNPNIKGGATVLLYCAVDGACGYNTKTNTGTHIFIPSIFWDQLQLKCGTKTACDQVKFYCLDSFWIEGDSYYPQYSGYLTYNAKYDSVSCFNSESGDNGCCPVNMKWGPTYTPTGLETEITLYCGYKIQCESALLDLSSTVFEKVTIYCNTDNACAGMVLYGPQYGPQKGVSSSLYVQCHGYKACYAAHIDSRYSTNTTITCLGDYACGYQTIYYGDADYAPNAKLYGYHYCQGGVSVCSNSHYIGKDLLEMQMECGTTSKLSALSTSTSANCYNTWGEFINSAVSIVCDQPYDCFDSFWELPKSTATIECSANSACMSLDVLGYDAVSIDVSCNGLYACYLADFQCPSTVEDSCKINCDGGHYACRSIDFYAGKNWILQYLDLTCDKTYAGVCALIDVYCEFDNGAPMTNLLYDSGVLTCDPNNDVDCCPFNTYSPTPSPTLSPTPSPTPAPTSIPTRNPSQTPTTSIPTRDPSQNPTTSIPTRDPSQNPTTLMPTREPSQNPTISLIPKVGDICIDGYKDAPNDAYCEPCGVNEAGTFGSCNECGNGKQPNNNHTECVLCDDNFIGINGYCDIDCAETNKITNELHVECVTMMDTTEKEYWYATAEFDAVISGIGVLTGCSCIGAVLYALCKKKLCYTKPNDVTDTNNEIKNLNTATNTNQHIQIVSTHEGCVTNSVNICK